MVRPVRDEPHKGVQGEAHYGWPARFCLTFLTSAFAMFAWCYFAAPAMSFGQATLAAATLGLLFGTLAAVFGRRVLNVLMNFPW
jgi:hypothetical protein